jgi:hypothetical protein
VHDELRAECDCVGELAPAEAEVLEQELLLNRDPLHYQVSYKQIAAKLNLDVAREANLELALPGLHFPPLPPTATRLKQKIAKACARTFELYDSFDGLRNLTSVDLTVVEKHLRDIEKTLVVLCDADSKLWMNAGSKPWEQLRSLLREIEGPTLVLWAMVALRVGGPGGRQWSPEELWVSRAVAPDERQDVIDLIVAGRLTPVIAVAFARGVSVSTTSRTCFSLACWYADIGRVSSSLRELALSLECGGDVARRRVVDLQLRALKKRREWATLELRNKLPADELRSGGSVWAPKGKASATKGKASATNGAVSPQANQTASAGNGSAEALAGEDSLG